MRIILILLFLSHFTNTSAQLIPQYETYPDLFDLYIMGEYDKCLKKALRYKDQEKNRREPRPYLYAAMCYNEIYSDPEKYDDFIDERPLKEALKYAYRFNKKDKYGEVKKDHSAFFEDLKISGLKEALYQCEQEDYRRSAYYLRWMAKVYPEDVFVRLALSMSQTMSRNRAEGQRNYMLAMRLLKEEIESSSVRRADGKIKPYVSGFFNEYRQYWAERNNDTRIVQTISLSHLLLGKQSSIN